MTMSTILLKHDQLLIKNTTTVVNFYKGNIKLELAYNSII